MPCSGIGRKWPRRIAEVATRLHIAPQDVRAMPFVDFREVMRLHGAKVKQTPDELSEQLRRLFDA